VHNLSGGGAQSHEEYSAKVIAIEYDALAITCAKENALSSGAPIVKFIAGLAEQELPRYLKSGKKFAAVLVDPPRAGLARLDGAFGNF